jgi:hypothetical protein
MTSKNLIRVALPLLFLWQTSLSAQKEVMVDHFDEFSAIGSVKVEMIAGEQEKVVLYIDGIPEKDVEVKVNRGVLRIQILNAFLYRNEIVKAYVTYKSLRGVRANAGAEVVCKDTLKGDLLLTSVTSGGQLRASVNVQKLEASASEGGVLKLYGQANKADLSGSTGGVCKCSEVEAGEAEARAGTGGRVEVNTRGTLRASASLGGEIRYRDEPASIQHKSFLGGDVRRMK